MTVSSSARPHRIYWFTLGGVVAVHAGALLAPFTFSWSALLVTLLLWWIVGCLGVTLGFHRLLAHKGFETPRWLMRAVAVLGTLALQGGPLRWVGTHRLHHKEADTRLDLHSPRDGFLWAHLLWIFVDDPEARDVRAFAKDLGKDRFLVLVDRFWLLPTFILAPGLFLLGGLSWVIWGIFVRTVLLYHATWLVNSACHRWGYRRCATPDLSRNNWWVSALTWGEGWHNNHHSNQRAARHGLRWFEIDATYYVIRLLWMLGLARGVIMPAQQRRAQP